jgi:hypothetical protein
MNIVPLRVAEPTSSSSSSNNDSNTTQGQGRDDQHPLLPWQYAGTTRLSYASQWGRKRGRHDDGDNSAAVENITVFGLAFFDCYLIGCTSKGDILFWKLKHREGNRFDESSFGSPEFTLQPSNPWSIHDDSNLPRNSTNFDTSTQVSSSSSSNRPILRLRLTEEEGNVTLYHCQIVERASSAPSWLIVSGDHGTNIAVVNVD